MHFAERCINNICLNNWVPPFTVRAVNISLILAVNEIENFHRGASQWLPKPIAGDFVMLHFDQCTNSGAHKIKFILRAKNATWPHAHNICVRKFQAYSYNRNSIEHFIRPPNYCNLHAEAMSRIHSFSLSFRCWCTHNLKITAYTYNCPKFCM